MGFIYLIRNKVNRKVYVGLTTKTVAIRWERHCTWGRKGHTGHIYNAIRKYGPQSFLVKTLATTDDITKLKMLEKRYIAKYRSQDPKRGYNLTLGGDGCCGYRHTAQFKRMISKRFRGQPRPLSVGLAVSKARKGTSLSAEHRKKIGIASQRCWDSMSQKKRRQRLNKIIPWSFPDRAKRTTDGIRKAFTRPEVLAHRHEVMSSPEYKKTQSIATKRFWSSMTPVQRSVYWRRVHPDGNRNFTLHFTRRKAA